MKKLLLIITLAFTILLFGCEPEPGYVRNQHDCVHIYQKNYDATQHLLDDKIIDSTTFMSIILQYRKEYEDCTQQ